MTVDCLQAKLSLSEKLGRNSVGLPNLETLVVLGPVLKYGIRKSVEV